MSDKPEYMVGPNDYLLRARARLDERAPASLFYAALELRCFVEARQDQYLDAQREYAKSIPKAWKIGAQGKALKAIFRNDQIQHLHWSNDQATFDAYHVPVAEELRNGGERLSDFLHAQDKWYRAGDLWWAKTRAQVVGVYRLAWACAQGSLISPVFLKNGHTIGTVMMEIDERTRGVADTLKPGIEGLLTVNYLDAPPPLWVCDLDG